MRILLVDDEVELTEPLSRLLQRQGYQVDVADDGKKGCEMALSGHYDLLILDWMLPGKSGLEICQEVRSHRPLPQKLSSDLPAELPDEESGELSPQSTPVLFLTAKDTLDDRVEGLDAGADDYLVKPFELRELLARVRALLRRPLGLESSPTNSAKNSLENVLQFSDLKLDIENQVACRGRHTADLSEKEVQLLAYLMRSPHQLLTHAQIYKAVWSKDTTPSSNTLAAQMRLLRRKIERPNQPPLIRTVYGKGYRFGSPS